MAIAKMTLIGMTEFLKNEGDDLWAHFALPPEIDKDKLVDWILMHSGEYPVLWANPFFVKNMIGVWSNKNLDMFTKWAYSMSQEYNPIWNYDRYEETTDNESNEATGKGKDTHSVTGYDTTGLQTNDQQDSDSTATGKRDYTHKGHLWGNIGVTESSAMQRNYNVLQEEWNLYDKICELFTEEFCLLIY